MRLRLKKRQQRMRGAGREVWLTRRLLYDRWHVGCKGKGRVPRRTLSNGASSPRSQWQLKTAFAGPPHAGESPSVIAVILWRLSERVTLARSQRILDPTVVRMPHSPMSWRSYTSLIRQKRYGKPLSSLSCAKWCGGHNIVFGGV